jgi:hypothetical protein
MAADRVAEGRERANQILALDMCGKDRLRSFDRSDQAALAHRARPSGLKQEVGLGHFEGRGGGGLHHHATLCIVARGFLISEPETISPLSSSSRHAVPSACRSRGLQTQRLHRCAPHGKSRTPWHNAAAAPARVGQEAAAMSMLRRSNRGPSSCRNM